MKTHAPSVPTTSPVRARPLMLVFAGLTIAGCVWLALLGYPQPVVKGIVQGLGEFLPISSSAHLILVPWVFGWQHTTVDTLTFDVALHLGTLAAIMIYFWSDWMQLLRATPNLISYVLQRIRGHSTTNLSQPAFLLASVLVATLPGAFLGLLLNSWAEETLRSPLLIAATLSIVGAILYIADARQPQQRTVQQLTWRDAMLIGLAQACALIPGVSRSGATMTMGRVLQLDRASAARYSFLLSAPITAAAVMFKLDEILHISGGEAMIFMIGVVVSAVVGGLTIHFLLEYVRRAGFGIFALYRIGLAAVIVALLVMRG